MIFPSTATNSHFEYDAVHLLSIARSTGAEYVDLFAESSTHAHFSAETGATVSGRLGPARYRGDVYDLVGSAVRAFGVNKHILVWHDTPSESDLIASARRAASHYSRSANSGSFALGDSRKETVVRRRPPEDAGRWKGVVERLIDAASSAHPEVLRVHAVLRTYRRLVKVFWGDGASVRSERASMELQVRVALDIDGHRSSGYAFSGSEEDEPEELARAAVRRAVAGTRTRPVRSGRMPVVIGPGWGGVWMHEAVGHSMEADNVRRNEGRLLASELVTIHDDGRLSGGRASADVDDEGVATRRTCLVEGGLPVQVLTDRYHAHAMQIPLTGNGRRQDFRYLPLPRMSNLTLEAGASRPEDLIASVSDGLYVSDFSRGRYYRDLDVLRLTVREARRILKGRLAEHVDPVEIVVSPRDLMRLIVGTGNDVRLDAGRGTCRKLGQTVPVSIGAPTVLFEWLEVRPLSSEAG